MFNFPGLPLPYVRKFIKNNQNGGYDFDINDIHNWNHGTHGSLH